MANKDALMVQAVFAFAQGAAGVHISREACAWLHTHYYDWISAPKEAVGHSPESVWDNEGAGFLAKFKEIGSRARQASGGAEIQRTHLEDSAKAVESEARPQCPYCP